MASGGFLALLDDVASFTARFSAATMDDVTATATKVIASGVDDVVGMTQVGVKGAGAVVADDIPVTANTVMANRILPERETAVIKRIERNALKARLVISPVTSLVSFLAPAAMPVILGAGGAYLSYEGTEKILHAIFNRHAAGHDDEQAAEENLTREQVEENLVKGAIPTDIIMGTEISFIAQKGIDTYASSLSNVAEKLSGHAMSFDVGLPLKAVGLLVTNLAVAKGIYKLVQGLVKMDDKGLELAQKQGDGLWAKASREIGPRMIKAAPILAKGLSIGGTGAMLWIGGELMVPGINAVAGHMGLSSVQGAMDVITHSIHHISHVAETAIPESVSFLSGFAGWAAEAIPSAIVGFTGGAAMVGTGKIVSSTVTAAKRIISGVSSREVNPSGVDANVDVVTSSPSMAAAENSRSVSLGSKVGVGQAFQGVVNVNGETKEFVPPPAVSGDILPPPSI